MIKQNIIPRQTTHLRSVRVESIDLGLRLNHLINRNTELGKNLKERPFGLILPAEKVIGSGVVVFIGEPGSGKSTLGLQVAAAAASQGFDSAYLSLEEDPERVEAKAKTFGWGSYLWSANFLTTFGAKQASSPNRPAAPDPEGLAKLLEQCRGKDLGVGKILLPGLLPRPLAHDESRLTSFFWGQYRQIEFLVRSAAAHNRKSLGNDNKTDRTGIRLIVIDSLNMLGIEHRNREMLHRLFDLFRQNHIMGIFTVESSSDLGFDSTMGDIVFKFSREIDSGYEITLLECSKSRFSARTQGCHPYKIKAPDDPDKRSGTGEVGIVALPSPHAVVAATAGKKQEKQKKRKEGFPFGWGDAITQRLLRSNLHRGDVVALAGPGGTFKTQIALNFLLHGLAAGESVLYLRLRIHETLDLVGNMMPYESPVVVEDRQKQASEDQQRAKVTGLKAKVQLCKKPVVDVGSLGSKTKASISIYQDSTRKKDPPQLILVDFPTGMLLAEEFIDTVRRIFARIGEDKIKRVVLDDVGVIGASYPLLKQSFTTGNLFLSAFLHVMRNYGVDLLLVGTTGDLEDANHMVNQACSLADAVLRTSMGAVFGSRYVLLTGDGMAARQPSQGDASPVVLTSTSKRRLKPDAQLLDEFVGF